MNARLWLPETAAATVWDVVIVGTGMGGATIGLALARAGKRVLFVEKGPLMHGSERTRDASSGDGWWPHRVRAETNFGEMEFRPPVGCVSGGSSAFFAAGLERFSPDDFAPRENFPDVRDSALPERWPIAYSDLEPYYERAEELFRVRGTQDPLFKGGKSHLLPPPAQSARDDHFERSFGALGLHPYRVHVGCEFVQGCDGCPAGPCANNCKRDAASTCLVPALESFGAKLLPNCEAIRLEAGPDRVNELICRSSAGTIGLRATTFVIAAGAFMTPVLLLRSANEAWPDGLSNRSGLVGRNLMFHAGDFFAISPNEKVDGRGPKKTLALNDFYIVDGQKLGTFQTLGTDLSVGRIMQYLRDTSEYGAAWWSWIFAPTPAWWRKLSSPFVRVVAALYYHLFRFGDAGIWVSIIEDLPYHDNRVWPDPQNPQDVRIQYNYSAEMQARVKVFRKKLRNALGRHRIMVLTPDKKIDYAHVSGTCRFGDDPASSVLDRNNRAHGTQNLYVVDASFFPSSAGTNPSLTIAANALRVADVILGRAAIARPALSSSPPV